MLPGALVTGGASAVGLPVSGGSLLLPGGPRRNGLSFVQHEVQAIADQFDYCEEYSH